MKDEYAIKEALKSPETLASVIHAIILQKYGEDAYEWDPLTVYMEVQADFGVDMPTETMDRWAALQIVMSTDAFFKRFDAFLGICNTLADGTPFFQVFDPVTVEEAAWAITEVSLNRELLSFNPAIKKYLKTILKQDGYNEGEYPEAIREALETRPKAIDIRETLEDEMKESNQNIVEAFVDDQLRDLVVQFDRIKSLSSVDDLLLRRQMDEFVGTTVEKEEAR